MIFTMPPRKEALNEDGSRVWPDSRPISALTQWTNWTNIFGMKTVNVHEAKTNFSSLLATVEDSSESFVICRNGEPVADLVQIGRAHV